MLRFVIVSRCRTKESSSAWHIQHVSFDGLIRYRKFHYIKWKIITCFGFIIKFFVFSVVFSSLNCKCKIPLVFMIGKWTVGFFWSTSFITNRSATKYIKIWCGAKLYYYGFRFADLIDLFVSTNGMDGIVIALWLHTWPPSLPLKSHLPNNVLVQKHHKNKDTHRTPKAFFHACCKTFQADKLTNEMRYT